MNDFQTLIEKGNVGFYNSCEVTQMFLFDKSTKSVTNVFALVSFEEKPFLGRNTQIVNRNRIQVDKQVSLGIKRYWMTIDEAISTHQQLIDTNQWNSDGDTSLLLSKLVQLPKQFVPSSDGHRLNKGLKNNFHNGAYVVEFFDETKDYVQALFEIENVSTLNKLTDAIKEYIPIDLSLIRDRIGNVLFQFPITVLDTSSKAHSTWDGIYLNFYWHSEVSEIPECIIEAESIHDKNVTGGCHTDYNGKEVQQLKLGSLDGMNHIQIWRKHPNLLLSSFHGVYVRDFSIGGGITNHEPRIFEVDGVVHEVVVSGNEMGNRNQEKATYLSHIGNSIYDAEGTALEKSKAFVQYKNGTQQKAFEDLKFLIKQNDSNGVYLWDPYLRSNDILKTLFFSESANVPLRAIGSTNKDTKRIYEERGEEPDKIIAIENQILDAASKNNLGLNIEFRMQHSTYGWGFHDRFLIFPGTHSKKPKAYSLGCSINSLGSKHHVLQELSHPQRVIDTFNELWQELNHEECLVWKHHQR